jgi:large subunit ribosomal protein L25
MKTIELKGTVRTSLTKVAVKQLRKNGEVPCVLYGENGENLHFAVVERELKDLVYTPHAYLVKLVLDGKLHTAVMREIQFHPVTERILHIDFYPVKEDRPVAIDVPVVIEGNSEGVRAGGKLHVVTRRLKISALPEKLPDNLPVDISGLQLGKTIVVGNLSYPDVNILTPKTTIVCAVKMTRAAIQASAAEAAEAKKK